MEQESIHIRNLIKRNSGLNELKDEINKAAQAIIQSYENGGKLLACGNGGSSSDSDHIVGELMKSFEGRRPLKPELKEKLTQIGGGRGAYLAENLQSRASEFAAQISAALNQSERKSMQEVEASIERIFTYAAFADKYDSNVHATPYRNVTLAMKEPLGVMGIVCPDAAPLLGFVSTIMPAIAMGNTVIAVPSATAPLSATDLYQVLETSDVPGGVINIITGDKNTLTEVLANHDDVDGLWYFGSKDGSTMVQHAAAENMKRTWVNFGKDRDWFNPKHVTPEIFLRHATQIKNIWVPYGE